MAIHVFVGPTLDLAQAKAAHSTVDFHPPIKHGDIFRLGPRSGDTLLIIDGLYHQSFALRHKELLHVLQQGVRVIGAASIGALRAAELDRFGMVGIGSVYLSYKSGAITGDDEVAVGQGPAPMYAATSIPLVNLRAMILVAESAGVVDRAEGLRTLELVREIYYPQRSQAALERLSESPHIDKDAARCLRWICERLADDGDFGNVKRSDALEAFQAAEAPSPSSRHESAAPVNARWQTYHYRQWSNLAYSSTVLREKPGLLERLDYQRLYKQGYEQVWTRYLAYASLNPVGDCQPLPLSDRILLLRERNGRALERLWGSKRATPPESLRSNKREQFENEEILSRLRPHLNLADKGTQEILLSQENEEDRRRHALLRSRAALYLGGRPDRELRQIRQDRLCTALSRSWVVPEDNLARQAQLRGFGGLAAATDALRPLLLGELLERMTGATKEAGDQ